MDSGSLPSRSDSPPRPVGSAQQATPRELDATILGHQHPAPHLGRMTLYAPYVAEHALPGQFVQLLYRDSYGPLMRRPFSILGVNRAAGGFDLVYLARGNFTRGMAHLPEGATVSVVGPLGRAFDVSAAQGRTAVLVAGGVGAPPLCFLARAFMEADLVQTLQVINGARTRDQLVAQEDFDALGVPVTVVTDDGSAGRRGTTVDALLDLIPALRNPVVYGCGPTAMLQALAQCCDPAGVPCQVSLETVMACGIGVCMGCVVKLRDTTTATGYTYVRACYEGPTFWTRDILWD